MTCYLRLHEVAVAVHMGGRGTDWDEVQRRWREASGVAGRDAALAAMPVTPIDLDDLPDTDLSPFAGLILAGRSDQQLLAAMRERVREFLDRGRVVVFSGQLTHDWLPGAARFRRRTADDDVDDAGPPRLEPHAVFDGVRASELGWAFLYRDGWHEPPVGAEVIARQGDGTPGGYVDQSSTGGTILLHGGANLLANAVTDSSAARIVPQLVTWVAGAGR